jgi:hypothetical protein
MTPDGQLQVRGGHKSIGTHVVSISQTKMMVEYIKEVYIYQKLYVCIKPKDM